MLYITGTPIGNLDDMSYRAIKTLKEADVILCEDTRITRKLTTHFEIDTPLKSYHDFNKEEVTESIIEDIKNGKTYALVTDAGMPVISDPGFELVSRMKTCLTVLFRQLLRLRWHLSQAESQAMNLPILGFYRRVHRNKERSYLK